jgi:hypothetical protein
MSRSTRTPVPGEHPDEDLLADLAAEVLADDLAADVQNHVIGCSVCASLLAEAEGIRSMLRQSPLVIMPAPVLARLERAMLTARTEDEAPTLLGADLSDTSTRLMRPIGRAESTGPLPGGTGARRIVRSGPATGALPSSAPATGALPTSRLNRMSRTTQGARRQAREEQKADRPSRLGPILRIAAVAVVVLGTGGFLFQQVFNSSSDGGAADTAASRSADGGVAPLLTPVQSTRTNYQKAALPKQVQTLIASTEKLRTQATAQADLNNAREASATPEAAGKAATGGQQRLLSSPAAVRACLTGIGAGAAQPLAIDLARYAGQEAAIIVLPADGGGYDVWVVARDCSSTNDSTIDVVHVAS